MRFALCLGAAACLATSALAQQKVSLLKGDLSLTIPSNFQKVPDKNYLAYYAEKDGTECVAVALAAKPLPGSDLEAWLARKRAAYSAGLPPDVRSHLHGLKQKTVLIDGKQWADLRFDRVPDGPDGANHSTYYTCFLATTVDGHLLEIVLAANQTPTAKSKPIFDKIIDSVKLKP